jgi:uncharacterized protein YwbE
MFPTGSKLFYGLTASAVAGVVVFGFFRNWDMLGVIGLGAAVCALALLAGVSSYIRDADVAAADATANVTSAAAQVAPSNSLWPLVGAAGGGLFVVGLVTDKRFFIGGLATVTVALVEWMVQAWAERASADRGYNRRVRGFILHPLEMPILGAVGLGALIYAFSRIMLKANNTVGPSVFIAIAALITIFGFIFSASGKLSKGIVAGICTVGAVGILGAGIWAAAVGERPSLAAEGSVFRDKPGQPSERSNCGEELTEADKHPSGSVSAKASTLAQVILRDNHLFANSLGDPVSTVYISRGLTVNIMFKNENPTSGTARRLVAQYLVNAVDSSGKPTTDLATATVCTNAIKGGKVQFITLTIPKPSAIAPKGKEFKFYVPGIPGAELPIDVLA